MRLALILTLAVTLTGCAEAVRQQQEQRAQLQSTVPMCNSDRECELKWSAARQWVLANAGMKLQHVTPDFLETYNPPPDSPNLAVRVVKKPMANGGYQLGVATWCNNLFGCVPDQWAAAQNFNDTVNAVGGSAAPGATGSSCPPGTRRDGQGCRLITDAAIPAPPLGPPPPPPPVAAENTPAPSWCNNEQYVWRGDHCEIRPTAAPAENSPRPDWCAAEHLIWRGDRCEVRPPT